MASDVYSLVNDRILAAMEQGIIPWRRPWTGQLSTNYDSGKQYRGVNILTLGIAEMVCGYTSPTEGGLLIPRTDCPTCGTSMRAIRRRDGGHSWLCSNCPQPKWFVADEKWNMVPVPSCSKCSKSMTHRERSNHKGDFFWACFGCEVFLDSDVFGGLPPAAKPRPTKEKSSRRDPCYATTPRRQA